MQYSLIIKPLEPDWIQKNPSRGALLLPLASGCECRQRTVLIFPPIYQINSRTLWSPFLQRIWEKSSIIQRLTRRRNNTPSTDTPILPSDHQSLPSSLGYLHNNHNKYIIGCNISGWIIGIIKKKRKYYKRIHQFPPPLTFVKEIGRL